MGGAPEYVIVWSDDIFRAVFGAVVAGFILRDGLYALGGWTILVLRAIRRARRRRRNRTFYHPAKPAR